MPRMVKYGLAATFLAPLVCTHSLRAEVAYQFPRGSGPSWLESVLVRDNGDLLLSTLAPSASIYTMSRPWDKEPKLSANITLPGMSGALGLVEINATTFAVAAARFENTFNLIAGTSEVWIVDFSNPDAPTTRLLARIGAAGELNDMVILKSTSQEQSILVVDSTGFLIWKVSVETGFAEVWFKDPSMAVQNNSTDRWPFGINGLRYGTDGLLYFSNTNLRSIYRIKTTPDGTAQTVEFVHEIRQATALDNFAVDASNRLWVTSNRDNKLVLVEQHGRKWKSRVVLGGDTKHMVAGDTAVAFGRTARDNATLYLVTSGALARPVPPNNFTEPAKLVRVDTTGV